MMEEPFHVITNNDIYQEILNLRKDFNCDRTKIKVNTWIATTALTLVIGVILGGFV